jgi:class 3 adenylate cyclase
VVYTDDLENSGDGGTGYIPSVNHHSDMEGPAVNMWYPVFSDFSENRTVAAILSMTTRWDSFLLTNLPPNPNGLIVVISNGCRQKFTFEITGGSVTYLGPEDYHEPEYESYKKKFAMMAAESLFTGVPLSQDSCPYVATVYPSAQMRSAFESNDSALIAIGVAAIFLFTIVVFIAYDFLVQRRQNTLAKTASTTDAIVSALFPKIVRDRLFDDNKTSSPNSVKRFMNQPVSQSLYDRVDLAKKNSPIADLFTNTTVMFGDIAGFTAWSSSKQPSEVFILLETLYGAFDKIARKILVFKVETIGDCYVAVTGLPNPQGDHHLRMVRFARQALQTMSDLTTEMEVTLGPGTMNLGFRIGLHSGNVTAGVLRGEKSRFQLFGDTVNMVSFST